MKLVLSGPDGTGKSSLVRGLTEQFELDRQVSVSWRRFGFLFARAFNLLARRAGWSYYEMTPVGQIGYHNFKKPWSYLYILLARIDCIFFIIPKWWSHDILNRSKTLIIDRFIFDIVADIILSTGSTRTTLWLFDSTLKSQKEKYICVFLKCSPKIVYERRPDVYWDKSYPNKVRIYTVLRRLYRLQSVQTDNQTLIESINQVVKICE